MSGDGVDVPTGDEITDALSGSFDGAADGADDVPDDVPDESGGMGALGDEMAPAPAEGGSWTDEIYNGLRRSPDKSLHEIDESEYFDVENGGTSRLFLVFDDMVTHGDGLENWMLLVIGCIEILLEQQDFGTADDGESTAEAEADSVDAFKDMMVGDEL